MVDGTTVENGDAAAERTHPLANTRGVASDYGDRVNLHVQHVSANLRHHRLMPLPLRSRTAVDRDFGRAGFHPHHRSLIRPEPAALDNGVSWQRNKSWATVVRPKGVCVS